MATKFESFLKTKKIDPRRLLVVSNELESLVPADRKIRLDNRQARKKADPNAKKDTQGRVKPRSGRPITPRAIQAAMVGKPLTGAGKTRLLRAVNRVLEQKKQPAVDLRALFDLPTKGNKKAEAPAAG